MFSLIQVKDTVVLDSIQLDVFFSCKLTDGIPEFYKLYWFTVAVVFGNSMSTNVHLHLKDVGHSSEDSNVYGLTREERWFKRGVKEASLINRGNHHCTEEEA